jgi:aminomethyltransferase
MTRTPPLSEHHADRGAKVTEFGGWEMPVQFDSINAEHESVRASVGKFDVSHMSQIEVTGPDAATLTDRLVTNPVTDLNADRAGYGAITDSAGTMLDDTITYRLTDDRLLFVPNAGHDEEMAERWRTHRDDWELNAKVENATTDWGMFAVQGPDAADALAAAASTDGNGSGRAASGDERNGRNDRASIRDLPFFAVREATIAGVTCLLARTGYTGEDGFELLCPADEAERVWEVFDCQPCGLGARDTLRIEAGFLLSGQDFDPETEPRTPYEAGIGFAVSLDSDFVGRDALAAVAEDGPAERLTGFELTDRGVPRHGYPITDPEGTEIGTVTSGTMSPSLGTPIGMGYLPAAYAAGEREGDEEIAVTIRGERKRARIEALPFIDT